MPELTTSAHALPAAPRSLLQLELDVGERVLWSGQPLPGKLARGQMGAVLFAIPWTAFAVCWTVDATAAGGVFGLFGVPFVLTGVFLLCAPWLAYRRARHTVYAITDRRALVIAPAGELLSSGRIEVESYMPHPNSIIRTINRDGSGDLVFAVESNDNGDVRKGFIGVVNVSDVEQLARRVLCRSPNSNATVE
jgi:hypothetical protein